MRSYQLLDFTKQPEIVPVILALLGRFRHFAEAIPAKDRGGDLCGELLEESFSIEDYFPTDESIQIAFFYVKQIGELITSRRMSLNERYGESTLLDENYNQIGTECRGEELSAEEKKAIEDEIEYCKMIESYLFHLEAFLINKSQTMMRNMQCVTQLENLVETVLKIPSEDKLILSDDLKKAIEKAYNETTDQYGESGEFHAACAELATVSQGKSGIASPLQQIGKNVHDQATKAYHNGDVSVRELPKLTKFVRGTTAIIQNPCDPVVIATHISNTKAVMKMNWRMGAGLVLAGLGVGLLVTATILTAGAIALPLAGVTLGFIIGGYAGGVSFALTGSYFAHRGKKGELTVAGEKVQDEAKKVAEQQHKFRHK